MRFLLSRIFHLICSGAAIALAVYVRAIEPELTRQVLANSILHVWLGFFMAWFGGTATDFVSFIASRGFLGTIVIIRFLFVFMVGVTAGIGVEIYQFYMLGDAAGQIAVSDLMRDLTMNSAGAFGAAFLYNLLFVRYLRKLEKHS